MPDQTIAARFIAVGLCLSVLCLAAPTYGDPSEPNKVAAKKHFKAGLSLLQEQNYAGAVEAFNASVSLYPTKNALFNLATACKAIHRYAEAYEAFARLRREFGDKLDEDMEKSVERHERELRDLIAELMVKTNRLGAKVQVGDKEVSITDESGALVLEPGEYTVNVFLDGYEPQSRSIKVISGSKTTAVFELKRAAAAKGLDKEPDSQAPLEPPTDARTESPDPGGDEIPAQPEQDDKRMLRGLFWGGVAGTVAVGALAGVFWGLTASSRNDYMDHRDLVEDPSTGPIALIDEIKKMNQASEDAEKYNKAAVGFTVGAGALAAATTVLFFTSRSDEQPKPDSGPEISVIPGGVGVRF